MNLVSDFAQSPKWVKRWCITDCFDIFSCWTFRDYKKALIKFRKLTNGRYRLRKLFVLDL